MQVSYDEGIAIHIGPESCAVAREGFGEALTELEKVVGISDKEFAELVAIRSLAVPPGRWKRVAFPRTSDHPSCCSSPPKPLENLTDTGMVCPLKCSAMQ